MKKNDIVTIATVTGEYIGKYVDENPQEINIAEPRMIVMGQGGNMGFAHGVAATAKADNVSFQRSCVVFVTETNDEVAKQYMTAISGLVL